MRTFLLQALCGSSPLARGARPLSLETQRRVRIIPARAGCTSAPRAWCSGSPDHPRSRGVHLTGLGVDLRHQGSSPLARGALKEAVEAVSVSGSSPLARGAHVMGLALGAGNRIIPARAGCTGATTSTALTSADHPRSRGVHLVHGEVIDALLGSSPLARGARSPWQVLGGALGIIPARAGCTRPAAARSLCPGDHPRSRGVHCGHCVRSTSLRGSSPLARGARRGLSPPGLGPGIIPARAGCTP